MSAVMQQLIADWNGTAIVSRYDKATEAWIFVALHDDTLGVPTGGTRMKLYESPEDGLRDAMRLSEGMTHKWAAIDLDFGGGKAVLALSRPLDADERAALLHLYGRLLNSLNGSFSTGEDLGTTPEDMLLLSRETRFVHGCDPKRGTAKDPGPYTALGVFASIRASLEHRYRSGVLRGRTVMVQGAGDVGAPLAHLCAEAGASVIVADLEEATAHRVAAKVGGRVIPASSVYSTPCDVYAPCAVGQTLNAETIGRLACRIVAGSANNQLAETEDAERLHRQGILYAPDYVVNAGGAMAFGLMSRGETDAEVIRRRVEGLGVTLTEILDEAADRSESPVHAARRRVERVLRRGRVAAATPSPGRP